MYAVIATGGKQYRVTEGDIIKVEALNAKSGAAVEFDQVLMLADDKGIKTGTPYLKRVAIKSEVIGHGKHKKVGIIKFRRRKHHMKQMGHRQNYTEVKITSISAKKAAVEKKEATKEEIAKKTAPEKEPTKIVKAEEKNPSKTGGIDYGT